MKNFNQILKQAQQLQTQMAAMQEKLVALEVTGSSGGGLVKVTTNGRGEVRRLQIDKSLLVPEEVEVLEDLVVAAINDTKIKVDEITNSEMSQFSMPGMKLPF